MRLCLHDIDLPLRHPFTTAHGTTTTQHNLLVELRDGPHAGLGESPSSRSWPQFEPDITRAALEAVRATVEAADFDRPEDLWRRVQPELATHPFALCALDEAAHDLWGRRLGQPVWRLWGLNPGPLPPTDYTIGLDRVEHMVAKLREYEGWPVYKIKLGRGGDLALVRELRRHTGAVLRVDANTGWTVDQTLALAPEMKALGVEFIEQPLLRDDWEGMKRVHRECVLPVIADEACQTEADVDRCAACFAGINIKLTKAGGLTPARRMIARARERGLRVMVGCMCESSVGIGAASQLLPLLDHADLDGALLLARDIAAGIAIERGRITLPETPGTGVRLLAPIAP